MSYSDSGNAWRNDGGAQPHAYDPYLHPELFRGVATRRVFAFLIDMVVISVPVILGYLFIAVFGVVTLGIGWALFWLAWPASVIWAIVYYGACIGGPSSATIGMRLMDLELRTWYGAPGYFVLGATHAVLFWVTVSFLSPFVVLVGLFNGRRRLLQEFRAGNGRDQQFRSCAGAAGREDLLNNDLLIKNLSTWTRYADRSDLPSRPIDRGLW
ncbi:putative RDD family membrane protein YckC [Bradyrhizobium sp. LM3.4]